jgi:hypothetical protein
LAEDGRPGGLTLRRLVTGDLAGLFHGPSTVRFLRSFTFGHVRQLDAVASRLLTRLAAHRSLAASPDGSGRLMVDIDDTIIEVHGYSKQGSTYGTPGQPQSTRSADGHALEGTGRGTVSDLQREAPPDAPMRGPCDVDRSFARDECV